MLIALSYGLYEAALSRKHVPISIFENICYNKGMKQLYLLRHAHAVSTSVSLSDFDRPLDERGQEEGIEVADYLHKKGITFDFIMCSAALRAQETLEPLRPIIGTNAIEISENFYNISEDKILNHLRQLSDETGKVLYIGHNPGIAFSILKFAKILPRFLLESVTPGTLVGLQFPLDKWMDLEWGSAEVIEAFQPVLAAKEFPSPQEP